ncbi:Rieske (2Fe-2S) protein [Streptomyces sp. NPDC050560]|uniref:Rieske (2Fe-2S) protein n=1 Tax=Streptomyces sp. NPDC050560 TaxID=3365630 RepID=UPI00379C59B1
MSVPHVPTPTRRTVVAAAGAVPLALGLAACGSGGGSDSGSSSAASDSGGSGGKVLAKTSDIPVGGGKVFGDDGVVVTQPKKGDFKAFSSTCTHQGCTVADVAGGTINCPCHGSKFSIEDGSVKHPPAPEGLATEKIQVSGSSIKTV